MELFSVGADGTFTEIGIRVITLALHLIKTLTNPTQWVPGALFMKVNIRDLGLVSRSMYETLTNPTQWVPGSLFMKVNIRDLGLVSRSITRH
jgi:hypothetical protein